MTINKSTTTTNTTTKPQGFYRFMNSFNKLIEANRNTPIYEVMAGYRFVVCCGNDFELYNDFGVIENIVENLAEDQRIYRLDPIKGNEWVDITDKLLNTL